MWSWSYRPQGGKLYVVSYSYVANSCLRSARTSRAGPGIISRDRIAPQSSQYLLHIVAVCPKEHMQAGVLFRSSVDGVFFRRVVKMQHQIDLFIPGRSRSAQDWATSVESARAHWGGQQQRTNFFFESWQIQACRIFWWRCFCKHLYETRARL